MVRKGCNRFVRGASHLGAFPTSGLLQPFFIGGNMDKAMKGVSIHIVEPETIAIVQKQEDRETWDVISLYPEQIDLLISWLREAKDEIQNASK
jgi:hypothetical protein